MTVRRDQNSGHWYFRCRATTPSGKHVRLYGTPGVSGDYHDLPQTKLGAQEAERRAIANLLHGRHKPEQEKNAAQETPTIDSYFETFMSTYAASHKPSSRRDKTQRFTAYVRPHVGHLRLSSLRQAHVDEITAALLKKLGRKGINTTLSVLSSLVKYAVKNGIIPDPDLRYTVKVQDGELVAVPAEDVDRLVAAATDPRLRVAILLAADAGLRIGEIRALPWLEVNELQRELTVAWSYDSAQCLTETKGWERRTVPITERLWTEMKLLWDCRRERLYSDNPALSCPKKPAFLADAVHGTGGDLRSCPSTDSACTPARRHVAARNGEAAENGVGGRFGGVQRLNTETHGVGAFSTVLTKRNGAAIGYKQTRDLLLACYARAGVTPPQMPWHALRHTFGTELANRGTPIHLIKTLLGHKDLNTTMRYVHVNRDEMRRAVNGLGRSVDENRMVK